jgi:hypothetical protein
MKNGLRILRDMTSVIPHSLAVEFVICIVVGRLEKGLGYWTTVWRIAISNVPTWTINEMDSRFLGMRQAPVPQSSEEHNYVMRCLGRGGLRDHFRRRCFLETWQRHMTGPSLLLLRMRQGLLPSRRPRMLHVSQRDAALSCTCRCCGRRVQARTDKLKKG